MKSHYIMTKCVNKLQKTLKHNYGKQTPFPSFIPFLPTPQPSFPAPFSDPHTYLVFGGRIWRVLCELGSQNPPWSPLWSSWYGRVWGSSTGTLDSSDRPLTTHSHRQYLEYTASINQSINHWKDTFSKINLLWLSITTSPQIKKIILKCTHLNQLSLGHHLNYRYNFLRHLSSNITTKQSNKKKCIYFKWNIFLNHEYGMEI